MGLIDDASGLAKTAVDLVRAEGSKELLTIVIDLQIKTLDLIAENRTLRRDVDELREALKFQQALQFRHNAYWAGAEDTLANGPYCSACWNSKHQSVRLHIDGDQQATCPVCTVRIVELPHSVSPSSGGGRYFS